MAALILRPPRGPPPPAPPRPRATPGGTSARPPPPPAPIGRPCRRSATVRASPAGAPEPHFRDGAWQAGAARPRPGEGGDPTRANPRAAGRGCARDPASCHPRSGTGKLRLARAGTRRPRSRPRRSGWDAAARRGLGSRSLKRVEPGSLWTPDLSATARFGVVDTLSPSRLLRPQSLHTPVAGSKPTAHHGAGCARGLETRHPEYGPEASGGSPQQQLGKASQRPGSAARWTPPPPGGVTTRRLRGPARPCRASYPRPPTPKQTTKKLGACQVTAPIPPQLLQMVKVASAH
ncbi:proline-rich protein 2-like [Moschus berezovskii]|uniref:proline-rich protein 2-like n=1 Tax=Moschus berezovskii TaxID=68408 RepID=UPI00244454BD|nr:proline-rich protein 2-like [Moschus berezovskii]